MNRGGSRPGAGRPRTKAPHKAITFSVSEDTIWYAGQLRAMGVKVNELVAKEIREAYNMKIEGSL